MVRLTETLDFEAGMRQQYRHEFVLGNARALGFEHDAHRLLVAGFVAHAVEHAEHQRLEVLLLLADVLLAGTRLRIGEAFDFRKHLRHGNAVRQFVNDDPPLAAGQFFDAPAGAHAQAAAAVGVGVADVGRRRNELAAAGEVRAGQHGQNFLEHCFRLFDQQACGLGHFAQVVRRDFGGHADRDAGSAIEQHHGQARRHQLRLGIEPS
jgi:hypothetical protein